MIEKINQLKSKTNSDEVKNLCESAIAAISSTIYNGVTPEARFEIERVAITNLFEGLSKHTKVEGVKEWLDVQKRLFTIKNLGIREAVNSLNESKELKTVLEQFKDALDKGVHESRLYEQFITALSPFGYFPTVGNAIKAVKDRVDLYKNDVDIIKILETMKESRSNYLVPLIADVVDNYLSNKNMQTRHQLSETLMKFTYDPFVRDIASIITMDATDLQLEYANAQCDINKVYSPVLYIGENEAVFAVNKVYYVKKGNNVSRLSNVDVMKLDEEFKTLCEALAQPNVVVERDGVSVYLGKDKAFITENGVHVNDKPMTNEEFQNAASISSWAGNTGFFQLVEFLRSNFSEIAEIDFVKRVFLKEDVNHSADIFKLRDNVFITTHNPELGKSTFYRNVNPIQARGIMMEHLRFDVTSLYQGLLPDEEKINEQIKETKEEYNTYIAELTQKINDFNSNPYKKDVTIKVVEALEEELKAVKDEYKDYLNRIEKYFRPEVNEEISIDINVDGKKYTVPIPQEVNGGKPKEGEEETEKTGTEVGAEHMPDQPASAVTFDQEETELIGDTPTIPEDEIDLGSGETEEEAEEAEKEKEEEEAETEEEGDDIKVEDEIDLDDEEKDELKAEDDKEEEDEKEEEEKKKKKVEPLESAEGEGLKKKKFIKEAGEGRKKKKVFLKRKVHEGGEYSTTAEERMKRELAAKEKEKKAVKEPVKEGVKVVKKKLNILLNEQYEGAEEIEPFDVFTRTFRLRDGRIVDVLPDGTIRDSQDRPQGLGVQEIIGNHVEHQNIELTDEEAEGAERIGNDDVFANTFRLRDGRIIRVQPDGSYQLVESKKSKNIKKLNEAQIGDTVLLDKQKGYIIGQMGDKVLVQVQGSTSCVTPSDVKVLNAKVETQKPPYEFDKLTLQNLTTKALFEQFVRCGIYVGNTPVKLNNCYTKYSDWKDSENDKPINVLVEGSLTLLPKSQVRILEDVNDFANLDNYIEGVEIDESTGEAIANVKINAIDYTNALGDADSVRIIRGGKSEEPAVDTVPKATLRTLAV